MVMNFIDRFKSIRGTDQGRPGERKISFARLLLWDIKERSWLLALILVVALVVYPAGSLMVIQLAASGRGEMPGEMLLKVRKSAAISYLGLTGGYYYFFILAAALLAGISGYVYLEKQDRSDFFLSLPMRRERYFFVPCLSGWLIVICPYLVSLLLAVFPVCASQGVFSGALAAGVFRAAAFNILAFSAVYSLVLLAMVLSGRMLIGTLLSVFLLFYGVCLGGLNELLCSFFYKTWYSENYGENIFWFSALTVPSYFDRAPLKTVAVLLIYTGLALWLAVFIYRKRPAETAENSLTFPGTAPFLKTAVAIPVGVAGGFLLWILVGQSEGLMGWFLFGSAACAFIANGVFEFVMAPDIRNIARHWISGLVVLLGSVLIPAVFCFDLLGYDTWLPDKSRIEAMAVSEDFAAMELANCDTLNGHYDREAEGGSVSQESLWLRKNLVEDFDGIYELAELGVREAAEPSDAAGEETMCSVRILYKMKGGGMRIRGYQIPLEETGEALGKMSSTVDFRNKYYPFGQMDPERYNRIALSRWEDPLGEYAENKITLDAEQRLKLLEALDADSRRIDLLEARESSPLYVISFYFDYDDYEEYTKVHQGFDLMDVVSEAYVYENYENTRACLEELGLPAKADAACRVKGAWCWSESSQEALAAFAERYGLSDYEKLLDGGIFFSGGTEVEALLETVERVKRRNGGSEAGTMDFGLYFQIKGAGESEDYETNWAVKLSDPENFAKLVEEIA
ncbi:MAG: DUF6449 domain-containing protein [Lachnospiraceae bacterium]|nr:DUF6449 domain-containing protein [Lachnospiraceae bacterium]